MTFTTLPSENSVSVGLRISSLNGDSSGSDSADAMPLIPDRNSWNHGLLSNFLVKGDPWSSPPGWEAISAKVVEVVCWGVVELGGNQGRDGFKSLVLSVV